ncbi:hypothetical protein RQP46_005301 [Phenoliferia psychrophenolica]
MFTSHQRLEEHWAQVIYHHSHVMSAMHNDVINMRDLKLEVDRGHLSSAKPGCFAIGTFYQATKRIHGDVSESDSQDDGELWEVADSDDESSGDEIGKWDEIHARERLVTEKFRLANLQRIEDFKQFREDEKARLALNPHMDEDDLSDDDQRSKSPPRGRVQKQKVIMPAERPQTILAVAPKLDSDATDDELAIQPSSSPRKFLTPKKEKSQAPEFRPSTTKALRTSIETIELDDDSDDMMGIPASSSPLKRPTKKLVSSALDL